MEALSAAARRPRPADPLAAGRACLARADWSGARRHFRAALRVARSAEALEGLGWAAYWLDDTAETLEAREAAYRLHVASGDARAAARVALGLVVDAFDLQGEAVGRGWLARARRHLARLRPCPEHGWLALWEGHLARLDGDASAAVRLARRSARISRRLGPADLELLALALEGLALVSQGRVEAGMQLLDESTAAAIAGEMSDLDAATQACCFLLHACERVRDQRRAEQWMERIEVLARRHNIGGTIAVCRTQHAAMLVGRGAWKEAERILVRSVGELARKRPLLLPEGLEQLGELRRRQGRFAEARELFAKAEGGSLPLYGRAAIAFDEGDLAACLDLARRLLRGARADAHVLLAAGQELLVRALAASGALRDAPRCAAALGRQAARIGTPMVEGFGRLARGTVEAQSPRLDAARTSFEDAVDLFGRAGAPHEEARARLELARVLAALGRSATATEEGRVAAAALSRLGATRDADRAALFLRSLQSRRPADVATLPRSARPAAPLTRGEIAVLRLVAEGLSDRDVAARLGRSEHTVHRHVGNVLTKLGLSSRAAAVAHAIRLGVL